MQALEKEWNLRLPYLQGKEIVSIYFGGGTPSLLGAPYLTQILHWIQRDIGYSPAATEITLEANPENITLQLMQEYAQAGINRASIGVQTLSDRLLKTLERQHSGDKAIEAVLNTYEAGLHNISIDLMYDLPDQTLSIWKETLLKVRDLPIKHLSLYNLTIEPHTTFFKHKENLQKTLPHAETSLKMYESAQCMLKDVHLNQYEISAFAKLGFHSKHNTGYWTGRPFLGFGPSAFSFWEGIRFRNIAHLNRYAEKLEQNIFPIDFEEKLEPDASLRERLVIQLRLIDGVNLKTFEDSYGSLDAKTLEQLNTLQKDHFLEKKGDLMRLTNKGILFYDTVASELI